MSVLTKREAPALRALVRKTAELETNLWLEANLPRRHTLPDTATLAAQIVGLRDDTLEVLRKQRRHYAQYVREHPPALAPVAPEAMADLPVEATLTYHQWLESVATRREWADDPKRSVEHDRQELAAILTRHLREAIGAGGIAALRPSGGLTPGFASLGQKAARGLAIKIRGFARSTDSGARAMHAAIADRAKTNLSRGAVLRDGAGRIVAAATYESLPGEMALRHLGTLEAAVPGSGLQMLRELAGLAAKNGQGLVLWAPLASEPVYAGLGFARDSDGRFVLSAQSALALAQAPPGPTLTWTRAGWLEGPEATFSALSDAEAQAEGIAGWVEIHKAVVPIGREPADAGYGVAVLRAPDGSLTAVAEYYLPAGSGDLVVRSLTVDWTKRGSAATTRRMLRQLAAIAADEGRGLVVKAPAAGPVGVLPRLGMAKLAEGYGLSAAETAAFATGLTRGAVFLGAISWELAVEGARDWLMADVIPGVVDDVSATTYRQLIDTLVHGLDRGEGMNDLIARIRALDETTFSLARAERIARTEVITANRMGGLQMAIDAGATSKKWVSRLMRNTRAWHREAHGQVVPIREPFIVNNRKGEPEKLMVPGDRSLGAGPDNTIQCACVTLHQKPGVSDDAAYDEHGLSAAAPLPGPVVASQPKPVGKRANTSLEELRVFVAKNKGWAPGPNANWRRVGQGKSKVQLLYHGTTTALAGKIMGEGFDSRPESQYRFGAGVYLTPDKEQADFWAGRQTNLTAGEQPTTLALQVDPGKTKTMTYEEFAAEVDPIVERAKKAGELKGLTLEQWGAKIAEIKTAHFRDQGYDSIHIKASRKPGETLAEWLHRTGGDQIVVFDHREVSLVKRLLRCLTSANMPMRAHDPDSRR